MDDGRRMLSPDRVRRSAVALLALSVGLLVGAGLQGGEEPATAEPRPIVREVVPTEECLAFAVAADRAVLRGVRLVPSVVSTLESVIAGEEAALEDLGPTIDRLGVSLERFSAAVDRYHGARKECVGS